MTANGGSKDIDEVLFFGQRRFYTELYPISEIVTLLRFTDQRSSDSYAANDGGSLWRYRFGEISTRHGCGVWRKKPRMGLKPGGCWRLLQSTTVRHAPRRRRLAVSGVRSSGTGCCGSTRG